MSATWNHKRRAFTLIEIMVAIALFGLVLMAIYSSWSSILKASKVGRDAGAKLQRSRITMRALEDSLLCARMFTANAKYYSFLADSEDDLASLSFVARLPKSFPRSGKFGDLDVRRLYFKVEPGPDSKKQLVLRQSPLLMDVDSDEDKFPLVLARDVNKFVLEFWDNQKGDWTTEWAATNQLPAEVRITLALERSDPESSEPVEMFVRTVALPANAVRADWELPNMGPGIGQPGITNRGGLGPGMPGSLPLPPGSYQPPPNQFGGRTVVQPPIR